MGNLNPKFTDLISGKNVKSVKVKDEVSFLIMSSPENSMFP